MSKFLQHSKELGVRLNRKKTVSFVLEITLMGHRITANGAQIDPEKIQAVTDIDEPNNVEELCCFFGMVNYVSKFLSNDSRATPSIQPTVKRCQMELVGNATGKFSQSKTGPD